MLVRGRLGFRLHTALYVALRPCDIARSLHLGDITVPVTIRWLIIWLVFVECYDGYQAGIFKRYDENLIRHNEDFIRYYEDLVAEALVVFRLFPYGRVD